MKKEFTIAISICLLLGLQSFTDASYSSNLDFEGNTQQEESILNKDLASPAGNFCWRLNMFMADELTTSTDYYRCWEADRLASDKEIFCQSWHHWKQYTNVSGFWIKTGEGTCPSA